MSARQPRHIGRVWQILLEPPTPPAGFGTVRVFHPSSKFRAYGLVIWCSKQIAPLSGLLWLFFVDDLMAWSEVFDFLRFLPVFESMFFDRLPTIVPILLTVTGIMGYLIQLPLTFLPVWLRCRTHWYMLGEEGVFLREGFRQVHEITIRFANIQQVTLKQNLLQRVFGIADVEVQTAGGGGKTTSESDAGSAAKSIGHVAVFRSVDHAQQLREVIRSRLGKPGQRRLHPLQHPDKQPTPEVLQAAQTLLHEATELHRAIAREYLAR